MLIPIEFAIYLGIFGIALGTVAHSAWSHRGQPREGGYEGGVWSDTGHRISQIAPRNTSEMPAQVRSYLREKVPAFAEMEDRRIAADAHADEVRRELGDPARPAPIMAGMAEYAEGREGVA